MKCGSFVPRVNNPHVATSSKRGINSISETTLWTADRRCGPGRWSSEVRNFLSKHRGKEDAHCSTACPKWCLQWREATMKCDQRAQPFHLYPIFFPPLMSSQVERNAVMSAPLKAQPIAYSETRDVSSRKNLWAAFFHFSPPHVLLYYST